MVNSNKNKRKNNKKKKRSKQLEKSQDLDTKPKQIDAEADMDNKNINSAPKRIHSGDDSDNDISEKPKKKKKRQQVAAGEGTSDKKGKKSIRQMKRENHAQRVAEAEVVAKDGLKSHCLTYLSQWKYDKQNWKFMKAKQVWVYKNKFNNKMIPNASWPLLLEYFESAQGNIRNMLLEDANKVIKQMDEWTESQNKNSTETDQDNTNEAEKTEIKPDDDVYKRARDLIQCLQE